jgi:hypothetical protein
LKYFICALDTINLGIPAEQTERIIPVTRVQDTVCETENQEIFISLPVLLRQKDSAAPHGVVLKSNAGEPSAVKTVILTPRIDVEMEIPEEDIYSLPEALDGVFKFFRGAYCTGQNVILILNTEGVLRRSAEYAGKT